MKNPALFFWGIFFLILAVMQTVKGNLLLTLVLIFPSLILLVMWSLKNFSYLCPKCAHVFNISATKYILSPHIFGSRWMKCPACAKRAWCKPVPKVEETK